MVHQRTRSSTVSFAVHALDGRSQVLSTHILEDDQDVLKSARSDNAGVHRTLPHVEIIKMHNCVRLSPMRGFSSIRGTNAPCLVSVQYRQSRVMSRT